MNPNKVENKDTCDRFSAVNSHLVRQEAKKLAKRLVSRGAVSNEDVPLPVES
jgi:hypothetical protein